MRNSYEEGGVPQRRHVLVFATIALLLAALVPAKAGAQTDAGTISGVVQDISGAAIAGTIVRVVNELTGSSVEVISNEQGLYVATSLMPGSYRLEIVVEGFEPAVRRLALDAGQTTTADVILSPSGFAQGVIVTARGIEEEVQQVTIPVSVVGPELVEKTATFNVQRLKELIPTVQFYSTNPRNSAINIRGLGAPFGLTNDGLDPGVGLYIDGVFHARPASATLDFLDVEQIEVLRGPQGTLYGKNTTAGAINITTRKPTFTPETRFELSTGSLGFVQAKASLSGPLIGKKLAGRVSFSGTQRNGMVYNTVRQHYVNDLNNLGLRAALLFIPSSKVAIMLAGDYTRQRPEGYTQVVAGVAPTQRSPSRQYPAIAADLGYAPPSFNAFDRLTDVDSPLRSYQDLGGASVRADVDLGPGQVTSITAWRYWNWNPSNDRDFIGLPVTTISAAPSRQEQWMQEIRYAGNVTQRLSVVVGAFGFYQTIHSTPVFQQEQGSAAARFLLAPTAAAATPGLLDGYGFNQFLEFSNISSAVFGQVEWSITNRLRVIPGLRFNYDQKKVNFDQQVYGGLQTNDPVLIALQRSIFAPQAYATDVDDTNLSGQLTVAYNVAENANAYATYSTGFKSVGLNLNGLPTDSRGQPVLSAATVKPEDVRHIEFGVKSKPHLRATANFTVFNTEVRDFQAQVVNADVGVLRGYLANAEKARVRGVEFDGSLRVSDHFSFYSSAAYTEGRYISFKDAPPPLEDTGGPQVKDISGSDLPGISKWAVSLGGEYTRRTNLFGRPAEFFGGLDGSYRSAFSSSATASRYLVVGSYPLVNARVGYSWASGWSFSLWARNLFDKNYFELLTAAPGNSGLFVGQPGDRRTFSLTLRGTL